MTDRQAHGRGPAPTPAPGEGQGRTALVTGASSGIGAQYARRLAEDGSDLVLVARRSDRLTDLADELHSRTGAQVQSLAADLAVPEDLARIAERAAADDVDLLVNNAGINGYGPFAEVDPALQTKVLALNVTAPTVLTRAAVPGMLARGRGAIVNVASMLAFAGSLPPEPLPVRSVYAGTKGYLVTFTRTLAAELAAGAGGASDGEYGPALRVQVLCPGKTGTEFHLTAGDEPVGGREHLVDSAEAMSAADVVTASLAALRTGEVVCVPALADPTAVERLAEAEAEVRGSPGDSGGGALADRYRFAPTDTGT